ncbi:MAG: FecR domain-containing protein [Patescibacteria group bacterium]
MKRSHKIGIGAVLALCLLVGVAAVWSLGASASVDVPAVRIETVQGTVQVKRQGATDWQTADATISVQPGDEVRTGDDGKANIRWGDRGETRLDPDTDLTIESAPADPGSTTKTLIELKLNSGRAWSRILKLLDVDSGFDVKTDGVVATVRGTAFGVSAAPTDSQLAVTESVVDVTPANGGPATLLKEGKWGDFSATGTPIIVRDLTPADTWPTSNKQLDDQFDEQLRQEIQERLQQNLGAAPEWLVQFSQNIHLALAPNDEKPGLISNYVGWRISEAVNNPAQADTLLHFDPSWFTLDPASRDAVLADLRYALFLETPRPGFTPPDGLFMQLQGLRTQFLSNNPADAQYAIALNLDDQIDQLLSPPAPIAPADFQNQGNSILNQIQDWKNGLPPDLSSDDAQKLSDKADALRLRLVDDGGVMPPPVVDVGATSTASSTDPVVPPVVLTSPSANNANGTPTPKTTTPPVVTPPTNSVPPAQGCTYQSFSLIANPGTNVSVGGTVVLSLFGTCSNGQTSNLSAQSSFSVPSSDGQVSGTAFTPSHAGVITVYGSYGSKTVSTSVNVNGTLTTQPKGHTLTRVVAGVTGGNTNVTTGESVLLTATAYYSDGTSQNVLYQCSWSTSDPKLGYVSGQRFYAGSGSGSVNAVCSYTEGAVTVTGSVPFTISIDAQHNPSSSGNTGGTRTYYLNGPG